MSYSGQATGIWIKKSFDKGIAARLLFAFFSGVRQSRFVQEFLR
jgi:hypothetical protein